MSSDQGARYSMASQYPLGDHDDPTACRGVRLADVQTALMNIRFKGKIGHNAGVTPFPLMTLSGLGKAAA